VDDAVAVGVLDRVGQQGDEGGGFGKRDRLGARLEPLGQRDAGAVGRDEETARLDLAHLVDRHQVGVVEPGGGARLAVEALAQLRRDRHVGARHFQGYLTAQEGIVSQVDDATATAAELAPQREPPQVRPGQVWRHGGVEATSRRRVGRRAGGPPPRPQLLEQAQPVQTRPRRPGRVPARRRWRPSGEGLVGGHQPV
jgi:hypothetical protein